MLHLLFVQRRHSLYKMENGQNMSVSQGKDSISMKSVDQRERMMTRRLKNRERQRRYRARKRLQADMERSSILNQPSPVPVEVKLSEVCCTTRVYCKRNWKKDARVRASQEQLRSAEVIPPAVPLINESEAPSFLPEMKAKQLIENEMQSENPCSLDNREANGTVHRRRDWKADARNKKN